MTRNLISILPSPQDQTRRVNLRVLQRQRAQGEVSLIAPPLDRFIQLSEKHLYTQPHSQLVHPHKPSYSEDSNLNNKVM